MKISKSFWVTIKDLLTLKTQKKQTDYTPHNQAKIFFLIKSIQPIDKRLKSLNVH